MSLYRSNSNFIMRTVSVVFFFRLLEMIRHRIGVRVKEVYDGKRIDEDYFVE